MDYKKVKLAEGIWEDLTDKNGPPARYFSSCFEKDEKIYLFGGKNKEIFRNDFWYYDPGKKKKKNSKKKIIILKT